MLYSTQIQDGTETKQAFEKMWDIFEEDKRNLDLNQFDDVGEMPTKEYILKEMKGQAEIFKEKLMKQMKKCGFDGEKDDNAAALRFLKSRFESAGIEMKKTIENWVKTGKVSHDEDKRGNIYQLCFALGMDACETEEFFLKIGLEWPFNMRDSYEAACFFCLKTGRRYQDVERLQEKLESLQNKEKTNLMGVTEVMGGGIKECTTEEEFTDTWLQFWGGCKSPKETAKCEVEHLLKSCYDNATEACKKGLLYGYSEKEIKKPDELLEVIYGYKGRGQENGKRVNPSISKSAFPKEIKENFPQRQQINNILKWQPSDSESVNLTYAVLRKTLIVLSFFNYFITDQLKRENEKTYVQPKDGCFFEFRDELNNRLEKCGCSQLYWRNPFDWMFGYCAVASEFTQPKNELKPIREPLDLFKDLINEFHLKLSSGEAFE